MTDILIKVDNISKKFCRDLKRSLWYGMKDLGNELLCRSNINGRLRKDEFWALKNVSFECKRGECLGLIGRNGAGKTTLLRMLNGLIKPDRGRIEMRGRVGALISLGAGFNPVLTGRENIYVNASVLGVRKKEIDSKLNGIIDFAEIGEFIDAPVQSYSTGMTVRLGFAIASSLDPDILILDEVLAVGDGNFQAKCFKRVGEILERAAVILVSHYPHHIKKYCDRVILLDRGALIDSGHADQIISLYQKKTTSICKEQPLLLLGNEIKKISVKIRTSKISWGGHLEFYMLMDSHSALKCDQSYLNIVDMTGNVHAQVVLTQLERIYKPGISQFLIKVGPLHLTSGKYNCNFVLYGGKGKITIAHIRHCLHFDFDGPNSLGPTYYPPSRVSEIRSQKTEFNKQ